LMPTQTNAFGARPMTTDKQELQRLCDDLSCILSPLNGRTADGCIVVHETVVARAATAIPELLAELAAVTAERDGLLNPWISVDAGLPEPGHNVLIYWRNELGKGRTSIGYHAPELTLEATDEWDDSCCDIVDGGAVYFQKEGWYESPWEVE